MMLHLQHTYDSIESLPETHLTAKPHAFAGSVLTPKHARELTPKGVLQITHTLGEHAISMANNNNNNNGGSSGNGTTPTNNDLLSPQSMDSLEDAAASDKNGNSLQDAKVQYTVWITEAWRVLGWAEPSAALFWEMATMYHTLHVAGRSIEVEETELPSVGGAGGNGHLDSEEMSIQRTFSQSIPPILSCESSESGKTQEDDTKKDGKKGSSSSSNTNESRDPNEPRESSMLQHSPSSASRKSANSTNTTSQQQQQQQHGNNKASAASAKELPVWLVGMFLLLHCEEQSFQRNISSEDERRFDALMASSKQQQGYEQIWKDGKGVDFGALLRNPSLSPRTQIHAGQHLDNSHCTTYLLRHLRKFLLLCLIPHDENALRDIVTLAESESPHDTEYTNRQNPQTLSPTTNQSSHRTKSHFFDPDTDTDTLLRKHDEEHGSIGYNLRFQREDMEKLNLVLQAPSGGLIDDPPLMISDLMPSEGFEAYGGIPLEDVEREIRKHLELELMDIGDDQSLSQSQSHGGGTKKDKDDPTVDAVSKGVGKMSMKDNSEDAEDDRSKRKVDGGLAQSDGDDYHKELSYTKLRGTTILLKPLSHPDNSPPPPPPPPSYETTPGARSDISEGHKSALTLSANTNGRLHDVHISDCSDMHMYLLQPFEHATISACTGCTIIVGAVAGLLHVVDCERTTITSAARRVLVSNCYDITHYIFTPSPPLLVGDNRSCQFAPYNTYYDGLRQDLLSTGLAAAVLSPENIVIGDSVHGPALQCASNKWKQPMELAKLAEFLHVTSIPRSSSPTPGSTEMGGLSTGDDTIQTPTLLPASDFQVLFVPLESEANKQRKMQQEESGDEATSSSEEKTRDGGGVGSQYCHNLANVLQLSPFRLPTEYERRALVKADRMKSLQQAIQTDLTPEQQVKIEEEINRGFRDWLVTSGNLRQVLDLVHLEKYAASTSNRPLHG